MTEKEYRAHPAVSRSQLWRLNPKNGGTPEKFRYFEAHPQEPTLSLLFGQAAHKLLLQPESFAQEFAVLPEIDRRTKEGRMTYNAFLAQSEGRELLTSDQCETAVAMAKKAMSTPFVPKLLDGQREKPFFWTDDLTGEPCKCRADCITKVGGQYIVVDYKTTSDASVDGFKKEAIKYGYDFQAAMYLEGVVQATKGQSRRRWKKESDGRRHYWNESLEIESPIFVFIAQEKAPPYSVNIFQADELFLRKGYDLFRELIGIYHYCKETNDWYGPLGPHRMINNLSLPAWAAKEME